MQITAQKREQFGKASAKLRAAGLVPTELYGHGVENMHLTVPAIEFGKLYKEAGSNTVITVKVGSTTYPVIVHAVQRDFVAGKIAHIDLRLVKMNEKMSAKVPLEFVGEAPAVKAFGAVLSKSMTEIEVEALPSDLPHRITIDISALDEVGKSVYVKDLEIPKGVSITIDPETAIVTAALVKEEVVETVPVDVSAVKVETEEKKEQRSAEKGEDASK